MYHLSILQDYKVAYIVFKNAASVQKAKQIAFSETRVLSTKDVPLLTGMKSRAFSGVIQLFIPCLNDNHLYVIEVRHNL